MTQENISLSEAMRQVASATRGSFIMVGEQEVNGMISYSQSERLRVKRLEVQSAVTPAKANSLLARAGWKGHIMEFGGMAWYPTRRR